MKDEMVEKFIKLNKSNTDKSIFITICKASTSVNLQFESIRKVISQLQEPTDSLCVRNFLYEIIQFILVKCDVKCKEIAESSTTDDLDFIKECIKQYPVVIKIRNTQIVSRLDFKSITKIAKLCYWEEYFSENFNLLTFPGEKQVTEEFSKTPVRFPIATRNVNIISTASEETTIVVKKNLENEFNNSANSKFLYLVTFNKNKEQSKTKKTNLPLNTYSINFILNLIGDNIKGKLSKLVRKTGFDAESITQTKINEKHKKYYLKLLKSENNYMYKANNLTLSYDSIKNILKKSDCKLHFKVSKYSLDKIISNLNKQRLDLLKTKFDKWMKTQKLTLTFKRGKTRVVSSLGNYYIAIHKYNRTINTAFNASSMTKIHNLLNKVDNKEDNQIVYKTKHVFWNEIIQRLTNYQKRLFGIYIPQFYESKYQYRIKHLNIKSKSMSKIMKQLDNKTMIQYDIHHALKKMIRILMNKFGILKLRKLFNKWKRKVRKDKLLEKAKHHKDLLLCKFISSKNIQSSQELNLIKVINTEDQNHYFKFNEVKGDEKIIPVVNITHHTTLIQGYTASRLFNDNSDISILFKNCSEILIEKDTSINLKFKEITKDSNQTRTKLRSIMLSQNAFNMSKIESITVQPPISNLLNFTEIKKDIMGSHKLINIELAVGNIFNSNKLKLENLTVLREDESKPMTFKEILKENQSRTKLIQCKFSSNNDRINNTHEIRRELNISKINKKALKFTEVNKEASKTYPRLVNCNFYRNKTNVAIHNSETLEFNRGSNDTKMSFQETAPDIKESADNAIRSRNLKKKITTNLLKLTNYLFSSSEDNIVIGLINQINVKHTDKLGLIFNEITVEPKANLSRKRLVETLYITDALKNSSYNFKTILLNNTTSTPSHFNEATIDIPINPKKFNINSKLHKALGGFNANLNSMNYGTNKNISLFKTETKADYENFKEIARDEIIPTQGVKDNDDISNTDYDTITDNHTISHENGFRNKTTFKKLRSFDIYFSGEVINLNGELNKNIVIMSKSTHLVSNFKEIALDRCVIETQKVFRKTNRKTVKSGKTKKVHSKTLLNGFMKVHQIINDSHFAFNILKLTKAKEAKPSFHNFEETRKDEACLNISARDNRLNENILAQIKIKLSYSIFKRYANEFITFTQHSKTLTKTLLEKKSEDALKIVRTICLNNPQRFNPVLTAYIKKVNPLNTLDVVFTHNVDNQSAGYKINIDTSNLPKVAPTEKVNVNTFESLWNTTSDKNIGNLSEIRLLKWENFKLFNSLFNYLKCIEGNLSVKEINEIGKYFSSNLDMLKRIFICLKQEFRSKEFKLFINEVSYFIY
jgi:hypothetical protein